MSISDGGVTVQNGAESSSVVEVKEKQDSDPILLQLKGAIHNQRVEVFSQGGDGVLRYQGRLCVPNLGELRQHILAEAQNSRYSIHQGATKMYRDLRLVYWWNGGIVAKCSNCQQVKVEHQKPGGMTQEIDIPTWKWEVINMDFITEWKGVHKPKLAKVIYFVRARKIVGQGCLAYLAHIWYFEVESSSIESIHVMSEFKEESTTDIPGMLPDRDINFCIDLEPGTRPISIPPYRMALAQLRELKAQIHRFLDKSFICPSASLWGCSCLVCEEEGRMVV
ncbi:hypothetical protein MTR67_023739 [Solanum verrucosum]|uniref:Integrase zinc-binding domain-containing protein n=1 Tax=Solanum verrucosum TaxID=315347 RepID=A0AAF0TSF8_SOLVR|nr:hypothetical protein MTR67_023739 [Solanum verrucosum]